MGQSESSGRPIAVSEYPKTTRSRRRSSKEASVLQGFPYGDVEGAKPKIENSD